MKNTILKTLIAILFTSLFSCQTENPIDPANLQGYWQSTTDQDYKIKIGDGQFISVHGDKFMSSETYEFHGKGAEACQTAAGNACISTKGDDSNFTYAILEVDGQSLSMYEVNGNGQPLNFLKTEAFDIPEQSLQEQLSGKTLCFQRKENETQQFSLELSFNEAKVTGYLTLYNAEAHTAAGSLKGELRDDFIFADYSLQFEGDSQVNEVSFYIDGDKLYEGKGEMEEKEFGGPLVFKDIEKIDYGIEYNKVECGVIAEHIQWSKDAFSNK